MNNNFLDDYERYLKPISLEGINDLIFKIGSDIHDDYVFYRICFSINLIHEKRQINGEYDQDLNIIMEKSSELDKKYGLKDDEYFPTNHCPPEYIELDNQYEAILKMKLIALYKEYDLLEFVTFLEKDPKKFQERFNKIRENYKEKLNALRQIINKYESEAIICNEVKAYNAACIMLASSIEAIMQIACSKSTEAMKILSKKYKKSLSQLTFEKILTLMIEAKLYPFIDGSVENKKLFLIAHNIRNLIHPGRRLRALIINLSNEV